MITHDHRVNNFVYDYKIPFDHQAQFQFSLSSFSYFHVIWFTLQILWLERENEDDQVTDA